MSDADIIRQLQRDNAELWKVNERLQRKIERLTRGQKWTRADAEQFVKSIRDPA